MSMRIYPQTRRTFLKSTAGVAASGILLRPRFALTTESDSNDLLGLLEATPRDQLIEKIIGRIKGGLGQGELMKVLTEAAVSNVQPYPSVGYKYHNVMVLQSLHLLIETLSPQEKFLPLLWQVDYFKRSQRHELNRSGWRLQKITGKKIDAKQAEKNLLLALDSWDREAADVAVLQALDAGPPGEVMEMLLPYLVRDYRSLGHKPITGANAHRMLAVNQAYAAGAVLRSTTAAITNAEGDTDPHQNDYFADRAWRMNLEQIKEISHGWQRGRIDWSAGYDLLDTLRTASYREASKAVVALVNNGISPKVTWDVLIGSAGEIMLNKSSFVALHANTMVNALYYLYLNSNSERTKKLILLQSASLVALFRRDAGSSRREVKLQELEELPCDSIEECYSQMPDSRYRAIRMAFFYLKKTGNDDLFIRLARRYTLDYAANSHDFKYAEAVIENYQVMQSPWRKQYLSTSMFFLNGPHQQKNDIVNETREVLL